MLCFGTSYTFMNFRRQKIPRLVWFWHGKLVSDISHRLNVTTIKEQPNILCKLLTQVATWRNYVDFHVYVPQAVSCDLNITSSLRLKFENQFCHIDFFTWAKPGTIISKTSSLIMKISTLIAGAVIYILMPCCKFSSCCVWSFVYFQNNLYISTILSRLSNLRHFFCLPFLNILVYSKTYEH